MVIQGEGHLYSHYSDPLPEWKWTNFSPKELSCRGSGEFFFHPKSFNALQAARWMLGRPVYINSGHRSWLYNIAVGGAPRSAHLLFAADISLRGFEDSIQELYCTLRAVGFTGFGFYISFIHVDMGLSRLWFGSDAAKEKWSGVTEQYTGRRIEIEL